MSGLPIGRVVAVLDALPGEMIRDPNVDPADLRLVADRLDHASRKCRALAECRPAQNRPRNHLRHSQEASLDAAS